MKSNNPHSTLLPTSLLESGLVAPANPVLTFLTDQMADEILSLEDDHEGELSDSPQVRQDALNVCPALAGPEATYAVLNALQLNGELDHKHGPALVLSAAGGNFAVQIAERWKFATVVFDDEAKVAAAVAKPLGSKTAIDQFWSQPPSDAALLRCAEIKPGIDYRFGALHDTGLPAGSFSCALIEQGHNADLSGIIFEADRLVRPGGLVILLGYGPFQAVAKAKPRTDLVAVKTFNLEAAEWLQSFLYELMREDERALLSLYAEVHFPFEDVWAPVPDDLLKAEALNMRATWNLHQLLDHLNTWPVVKRIESAASPDIVNLNNFRKTLRKAWGSPKKRRVIVWPVALRMGRKHSVLVGPDAAPATSDQSTVAAG